MNKRLEQVPWEKFAQRAREIKYAKSYERELRKAFKGIMTYKTRKSILGGMKKDD